MTDQDLGDANGPRSGDVYGHYKGGVYVVVCVAVMEADLSPVVVYRKKDSALVTFVRPLMEFVGYVDDAAVGRVSRFYRVEDARPGRDRKESSGQ